MTTTSNADGALHPGGWPDPPDDSVVGTPPRRPGSVRRTANINMVWPGGWGRDLQLRGRSRDLLTPVDGDPVVLAEASMVADIGFGRTITSISVTPERPGADQLVGAQGGSRLRSAIDEALPGERESATPLHFLLDDIAGCSLIAGFAWSQAKPDPSNPWPPQPSQAPPANPASAAPTGQLAARAEPIGFRKGRIICSGLRPGGYHERTREAGNMTGHFLRTAGDLSSDDPWAWHDIEPPAEVCMRRRRRVDVWREGGLFHVDAHFRDSCWHHIDGERALHEYTLQATLDADRTIVEIAAQPRALPFPECTGAPPHISQLVGMDVSGFRTSVQETLTELEACTHLNDMLRCLAEVGALSGAVQAGRSA